MIVAAVGVVSLSNTCAASELDLAKLEKLDASGGRADDKLDVIWYDAKALPIEGKGWTDTEAYYDRLPARAKETVRGAVWSLSKNSAGMAIRFVTDSDKIAARWTVAKKSLAMAHMPATGVSGLDLYVKDGKVWRWIGNGRPGSTTNQKTLAGGIPAGAHEYLIYLPLYNGTKELEIGIRKGKTLAKAPPRPGRRGKPIVYYGTSIAQGGCAARPGMVHTSILGRMLDWHVINLGFSGNGQMEMALEKLIAELDAAMVVLDCLPNLKPALVTERTEPFVKALRKARPDVPIVLVENIAYQAGYFLPGPRESYQSKNAALKAAYDRLVAAGVKGLTYIPGDRLLGTDGEATVDGTHCTDLGYMRMAEFMAPILRRVLEGK